MLARSTTTGWPEMSLPRPSASRDETPSYWLDLSTSPSTTISRSSLGISSPIVVLPGMTSTMRTLTVDSDRARSLARLVTRLTFSPGAG